MSYQTSQLTLTLYWSWHPVIYTLTLWSRILLLYVDDSETEMIKNSQLLLVWKHILFFYYWEIINIISEATQILPVMALGQVVFTYTAVTSIVKWPLYINTNFPNIQYIVINCWLFFSLTSFKVQWRQFLFRLCFLLLLFDCHFS